MVQLAGELVGGELGNHLIGGRNELHSHHAVEACQPFHDCPRRDTRRIDEVMDDSVGDDNVGFHSLEETWTLVAGPPLRGGWVRQIRDDDRYVLATSAVVEVVEYRLVAVDGNSVCSRFCGDVGEVTVIGAEVGYYPRLRSIEDARKELGLGIAVSPDVGTRPIVRPSLHFVVPLRTAAPDIRSSMRA